MIQRGRPAVRHPLFTVVRAHPDGAAGGAIVHEDIPEQIDVALRGLALTVAEQIAGQRLKRDRRSIVGERRAEAAAVPWKSLSCAADQLRRP